MLGFALPDTAERHAFARRLLCLYAVLGVVIAPVSYLDENHVLVALAVFAVVTIPAVLRWSAVPGKESLQTAYALVFLLGIVGLGGLDQMHRMANLIWLILYPFMLFYLAGLEAGAVLTAMVFAMVLAIYWAYPYLGRPPRVPAGQFVQLAIAYLTAGVLGYYQEAIRKRHEAQLIFLSERDFLTELDNRRGFLAKAATVLAQARRLRQPFGVVLLDLDDFKSINDRYGHDAGDMALRTVADVIRRNIRQYDLVGRWGGEEFILLLPQCDAEGAWRLAEKLRHALPASPLPCGERMTASFGLALHAGDESLDAVIARADEQMYQAKKTGKNRIFMQPALAEMPSAGG